MMSSEVGTKKRRKGLKEGIRGICIRFGEGGLRDIFPNKMFCFVVWNWCREEGRGGGRAGGRGLKPQSSSLKLSGSVVPGGECLATFINSG